MPTYELTCKDCGEAFELFFMRMLREEDKMCPACGSRDIRTGLGGGFLRTKLSAGASAPSCGDRGFT